MIRTAQYAVALVSMTVAFSTAGQAANLMPSFATVPTGWSVDRYAPDDFSNIGTYQWADNVLGIKIGPDGTFTSRAPAYQYTFYNTQGMSYPISGGVGSSLSAYLYVPGSWSDGANGFRRTDEWGVMVDGSSAVSGYPILGFTNYGGTARFRAWDDTNGVWVDLLSNPVQYDDWNLLSIVWDGINYDYFINGVLATSLAADPSTAGFSSVIMQAYNAGGDPSIPDAVFTPYTAYWANAVPEPATLAVLGFGLAGLLVARRRGPGRNDAAARSA